MASVNLPSNGMLQKKKKKKMWGLCKLGNEDFKVLVFRGWGFQSSSVVKTSPAKQETWV